MEKTCKNCGTPITKEYCEDNYPEVCEHWTPKKPMTNADRIRAMSDDELAKFICSMVDGSNSHEVACYGCLNFGTHHSDPINKGTSLYECEGCPSEGVGLDIEKWLKQPAGEGE